MQITIEDISPVEKRVDFEVPWAEVAPKLDRAYDQLRREVRLKGFRPGKAPRPMLERLYRHRVEDDVARELIELSIGQAVHENQIQPVAPPTVDKLELKAGEPFRFSARVEVRSQVTPREYTGIPLTRRAPKVSDEEVSEVLESYRRRLTEWKPIEGRTETAASDMVVAELHGQVGEHHLHKTGKDAVSIDLEEAEGGPLPGLVPRLRGLPLAQPKHRIRYKLSDDLQQKELAGQDVDIEVTIKDARERVRPELDDDLAKDTGEAETLAGLKDKVRERLVEQDRQRAQRELIRDLLKEIIRRNPFAVAPALVDRHAGFIVRRARAQLLMAGIDVAAGGRLDEERMKKDVQPEAEEEARATILLQAIAEREGVTVADADLQKRIAEIAASRRENAKKIRAEYERDHLLPALRHELLEQKTLDMLISQAKITDEDPDRLIIAPGERDRLIVTPDEARAERAAAERKKRER